ncbi:hypothetical protein [Tsukamurella pseudospumae]|uniref:DUF3828 domain-containing protein n=1 Tax=Tsukamurella pseudospumae TaxID=239498 RepID=A0A137ZXZ8_9ACTN|nr:hypothetical protein [Tsukamurella pseudospumae]KXP03078.1 hypothetical protein AXK60_14485 [Tsukamurella pseudospumae]
MISRGSAAVLMSTVPLAALGPAVAHAAPAPGDEATARRIACEQYAVGAATVDYREFGQWRARLTRGTTPELARTLTDASVGMESLYRDLQWVSTAGLAGAEITSLGNDTWRATCFVRIRTTSVKAPAGASTVSVYNVTLDKKRNWQITDIEGDPAAR